MRKEPAKSQLENGMIARSREFDQLLHDLEICLGENFWAEPFGGAAAFGELFSGPIFSG